MVGDEERLLTVGEWTDWVPVSLDLGLCGRLVMNPAIPAMARFYLKSVRPEFELYVSPLNLDPMQPVMPISTPADYAARLAAATGRFYTQGMPEDTKAVEGGVLDRAVFMDLVHHTLGELVTQYRQCSPTGGAGSSSTTSAASIRPPTSCGTRSTPAPPLRPRGVAPVRRRDPGSTARSTRWFGYTSPPAARHER